MTRPRPLLMFLSLQLACGDKAEDEGSDADCPEDERRLWYADEDGDSHGDPMKSREACEGRAGWTLLGDDCDDTDAAVHPVATEHCNGIDDDCDGLVDDEDDSVEPEESWFADDDGDGFGDADRALQACLPPSGHVASGTDCDDADPAVNPEATEVCDELGVIDEDCDGLVDDADDSTEVATMTTWSVDDDGDGYGDAHSARTSCVAPEGSLADATDCDDSDAAISPESEERCDGDDNDCDGLVDDEDPDVVGLASWYVDADGDGHGVAGSSVEACDAPSGHADSTDDCDDSSPSVNPDEREDCASGADEDCDGLTDCEDGDCYAACTELVCDDGLDDDGDGVTDCDDSDCAGTAACQVAAGAVMVSAARGVVRQKTWDTERWSTYSTGYFTTWGMFRRSTGWRRSGTLSSLSGQVRVYRGSALASTCTWVADGLELDWMHASFFEYNDDWSHARRSQSWVNLQLSPACAMSSFPSTWTLVVAYGSQVILADSASSFTPFASGATLIQPASAQAIGPGSVTSSSTGWRAGPGSYGTKRLGSYYLQSWSFSQIRSGSWVYP